MATRRRATRRQQPARTRQPARPQIATAVNGDSARDNRVTEKIMLAILGLAIAHLLLYFFLTGDARAALDALGANYQAAELESTKAPGVMPVPGTEAYAPWLRSYERFSASKDYELHARHESLMRYGMMFSFLIALGFLGSAMHRISRSRRMEARFERAPQPQTRRKSAGAKPAITYPTQRRYRRSA